MWLPSNTIICVIRTLPVSAFSLPILVHKKRSMMIARNSKISCLPVSYRSLPLIELAVPSLCTDRVNSTFKASGITNFPFSFGFSVLQGTSKSNRVALLLKANCLKVGPGKCNFCNGGHSSGNVKSH